jgi:hypothetical protein
VARRTRGGRYSSASEEAVTTCGNDYGDSGLTIQAAMVDHARRFPDKRSRPRCILWNGRCVVTGDVFEVPREGVVRGEFVSSKTGVEQGFDLKVNGWIELAAGERVPLLRTWHDPRYEPSVAYRFHAADGLLRVWNVYKMRYPSGESVEERWTENAGIWVEQQGAADRIYHCSHGMAHPPDFESLIFRISIQPAD